MTKDIKTLFLMFKQLYKILNNKQKWQMMGIFFLIVVGAFVEMLGISAILPFIQAILTPEKLADKWYFRVIIETTDIRSSYGIVVLCGVSIIGIYLFKNLFLILSTTIQSRFRCRFQKDLSTITLRAYIKKPYTFFLNVNSAEILRGISSDVFGTFSILQNLFRILSESLTIIMIGIFIIYTDPFMAGGILSLAIICFVIITLSFKPVLSRVGKEQRIANAKRNQYAYQVIMGIKEVKVMKRENMFLEAYSDAYEEQRKTDVTYEVSNALPERIMETICIIGLIAVVCLKMKNVQDATVFVTQLSTFALSAFKILPSISRLVGYLNSLVFYRPALEAVYNNIGDIREYEEIVSNPEQDVIEDGYDLKFNDELKCDKISWKYDNSKEYVLKKLDITIQKGEAVALIGTSGAGKTTLSDCILGLLKPQAGTIEIDGKDIFSISKQWSRIIGYVPQTVFLIDDTVKANITFGLPVDKGDEEKIWYALEQAQLKQFVENLPDGLDTMVGERGVKFSGGQRQRIAIARALYYNPEILVLDEATSALDMETETAVMESIERLQGHKTLIIVAHRLTTIRNCDKIYEVVDGKACLRNNKDVFEDM